LRYLALSIVLLAAAVCWESAAASDTAPRFTHIIMIVQENRTPDNLFGSNPTFEPGVDLATSGTNSLGKTIPLTGVALAGCYDIAHTHAAFESIYDGGKMDGADNERIKSGGHCKAPADPQFKFVENTDGLLQPYFDLASQYGFANRMFQTNQGPSFPAHQFLFGGTSAPDESSTLFAAENVGHPHLGAGCVAAASQRVKLIDAAGSEKSHKPIYPCFNRPTLADLLNAAGLSWTYYSNTKPEGSIWIAPSALHDICGATKKIGDHSICTGTEYTKHVDRRQAHILTDIADCKLPNVSWVIPDAAESDHAGINNGTGPAWVASVVNAVGNQPRCGNGDTYWDSTAILITWDDWGGWYDHVPPFHVGGWGGAHNWGAGYIYGLRVPLLVVSAYTKAGYVDNTDHDFGSMLKFVESNFGLGLIGPGYYADAHSDDLSAFFPLGSPRTYKTVPAKWDAQHFLTEPRSDVGPDDD
jgi:phospholipase C